MARVTVEDCLEFVDTNYELVLKASKRARDISEGAQALVEEDNDKPVVIALREIAENVSAEEVLEVEAPDEMTLDQDQTQEPVEISIG
ncbi:UNVERIFIED_CONTAM: hypothetical protein GTU68_065279 [Idotea baltica]|nr:hypothetical protein [Idotea baltica]